MGKANAADLERLERCDGGKQYTTMERIARALVDVALEMAMQSVFQKKERAKRESVGCCEMKNDWKDGKRRMFFVYDEKTLVFCRSMKVGTGFARCAPIRTITRSILKATVRCRSSCDFLKIRSAYYTILFDILTNWYENLLLSEYYTFFDRFFRSSAKQAMHRVILVCHLVKIDLSLLCSFFALDSALAVISRCTFTTAHTNHSIVVYCSGPSHLTMRPESAAFTFLI